MDKNHHIWAGTDQGLKKFDFKNKLINEQSPMA